MRASFYFHVVFDFFTPSEWFPNLMQYQSHEGEGWEGKRLFGDLRNRQTRFIEIRLITMVYIVCPSPRAGNGNFGKATWEKQRFFPFYRGWDEERIAERLHSVVRDEARIQRLMDNVEVTG